jgi:hypothetical protein
MKNLVAAAVNNCPSADFDGGERGTSWLWTKKRAATLPAQIAHNLGLGTQTATFGFPPQHATIFTSGWSSTLSNYVVQLFIGVVPPSIICTSSLMPIASPPLSSVLRKVSASLIAIIRRCHHINI